MRFLYNDKNEKRMVNELLSELKAKLKDRRCELKDHMAFDRLSSSTFLGNIAFHDSSFSENISDLKTFYDYVIELENLFKCGNCDRYISKKYYDSVEDKIRCACEDMKYEWKK